MRILGLRRPVPALMVTRVSWVGKGDAQSTARRDLTIDDFGRRDLDSESGKAYIGAFRRGQQSDRTDAEVLENLSAEPDLAPLLRAGDLGAARTGLRDGVGGNAGSAVAQEDNNPAPLALEMLQRKLDRMRVSKHVTDDVGAMQPRQDVFAVADAAIHESHMLDRIEGRHIGIALQRAELALNREFADALDQLVADLAVSDQLRDGNLLEPMLLGKRGHRRAAGDRSVIVHQLGKHADRRQPGQSAEIDTGFGMA